jgi:RNA polymerase sigma factor (TIGR02999 family)
MAGDLGDHLKTGAKSLSVTDAERVQLTYDELCRMAGHHVRRKGRTLEAAELVSEAYIRLAKSPRVEYRNDAHFFGVWSRSMRQFLIEDARRAHTKKRGGGWQQVDLEQVDLAYHEEPVDPWRLDKVLSRLNKFNPRWGKIIELRIFRQYSTLEIAAGLRMGESTVRRDRALALDWLRREAERPTGERAAQVNR